MYRKVRFECYFVKYGIYRTMLDGIFGFLSAKFYFFALEITHKPML